MALITKRFKLDITPGAIPQIINVSLKDIGRAYEITLMDDGGVFTIPAGTNAKVEGTMPRYPFSADAAVSGNTITFQLTTTMTAVAGDAWTKIMLTKDNEPVSTCAFILRVDRGLEAQDVIDAPGFQEQIAEAVEDYIDSEGIGAVRYDQAQAYMTEAEKILACDNIGAGRKSSVSYALSAEYNVPGAQIPSVSIGYGVDPSTGQRGSNAKNATLSVNLRGCGILLSVPDGYDYRVFGYSGTSSTTAVYIREITDVWTHSDTPTLAAPVAGIERVTVMFRRVDNADMTDADKSTLEASVTRKHRVDQSLSIPWAAADAAATGEVAGQIRDELVLALRTIFPVKTANKGVSLGRYADPDTGAVSNNTLYCTSSRNLVGVPYLVTLEDATYLYRIVGYNGSTSSTANYIREITSGWRGGDLYTLVAPLDNITRMTVCIARADGAEMTTADRTTIAAELAFYVSGTSDGSYTYSSRWDGRVLYTDGVYPNAQGLCTDREQYIYIACRTSDTAPTMLRKIDTEGNLIASNGDACYCHANGMTYCTADGKLYIATLGNMGNVTDDTDEDDPQRYNIIGVADGDTLEPLGFINLHAEMLTIGAVYKNTTTTPREMDDCPHIAGIYYDDTKGVFVCLVSPHYLTETGNVKYRGFAEFDSDWHLIRYVPIRQLESAHLGSITSDGVLYYVTANTTGANNDMYVYDKAYNYLGICTIASTVTSEFECADFIGETLYGSLNTNPCSVEVYTASGLSFSVAVKTAIGNGNILK